MDRLPLTSPDPTAVSRRALLGAAGAALTWSVVGRIDRADAAPGDTPPGFPAGIDLHRLVFTNWDTTIRTDELWTSTVTSAEEVVAVANWAAGAGYRVRPRGYAHTWSPLVVDRSAGADVVLVDTNRLAATAMEGDRVRVQAGARMDDLLAFLSTHDRSLVAAPAPGGISVGGVLAVDGHGTGVPRRGEAPGLPYGTVSNLVVSLTAVVWDPAASRYVLRTFARTDPDCAALLTHLGRAFVTEVVLGTVPNYRLRCRNTTTIPATQLFAPPGRADARSLSGLLDSHGRVGVIWYAFTANPWVQLWDVAPTKPLLSRRVSAPYNYPFADTLSAAVTSLVTKVTQGAGDLTPRLTQTVLDVTRVGLITTGALDMWGEARFFINFVRPTTLRVSAASHAVVTRRADVQRVVHEFTTFYTGRLTAWRARGLYPANNTCEIRVTGIDDPARSGVDGARTATLSAAAPVPGRPELDTVVWLDVLSLPNTPRFPEFCAELDAWFHALSPSVGVARPEWAKRFAHTAAGPWTDTAALRTWIPGQIPGFAEAAATLDRLDPSGLYRAPLHDRLMPRT